MVTFQAALGSKHVQKFSSGVSGTTSANITNKVGCPLPAAKSFINNSVELVEWQRGCKKPKFPA